MNKKFLAIILSVLFLISISTVVGAEEAVSTEEPSTTVSSPYSEYVAKVEAYASTGYEPSVAYTSDSVRFQGILLEPYMDTVKFETGFIIRSDLDSGVEIYDDPTTDIIEGIRVNGQEVTSYIIKMDLDNPQNYIVDVRLVYSNGLMGTLAKISDGKFDWQTIMQEPFLAMQGAYYVLAALSLIITTIGALTSKKKRVKTTDEIAAEVDARAKEGYETFAIAYTTVLKENLLPVFQQMVDTNKAVIKAITLSTSKSKEAPVALLDLLRDVSDIDVEKAIDSAREEVLKNIANVDAKRAAIHDTLQRIVDGTYQEVHHVEKSKQISTTESKPETSETSSTSFETKSLF